jgi:hypothetical protein
MAKPTKEQITLRAYQLWEENNKPEGRDEEFYRQAEKELSEGPLEAHPRRVARITISE